MTKRNLAIGMLLFTGVLLTVGYLISGSGAMLFTAGFAFGMAYPAVVYGA